MGDTDSCLTQGGTPLKNFFTFFIPGADRRNERQALCPDGADLQQPLRPGPLEGAQLLHALHPAPAKRQGEPPQLGPLGRERLLTGGKICFDYGDSFSGGDRLLLSSLFYKNSAPASSTRDVAVCGITGT